MNASRDHTTALSLPAAFSLAVARYPQRPAIIDDGIQTTYSELDELATRVSRVLAATGGGPGRRVGLVTRRQAGIFPLLLGVLKTGACVVPINPDYPDAMKRSIAEQAALDLILAWEPPAWAPRPDRVILASHLLADTSALPPDPDWPQTVIDPESPAYILFTSGSTARPKGVVISHRGISRLADGSPVQMTAADRVLQSSPLSFASSMSEVWFSLLSGSAMVVAPPGKPSLPELGTLIARHGITFLNLPCGLLRLLIEHELDRLRLVRAILVSGDFMSLSHTRRLLAETSVQLIHGYGCTENSAITSMLPVTTDVVPRGSAETLSLGQPLPGVRMSVRNDLLDPVGPGETGELCIAGAGLALGYLGQPELTDAKFVIDPGSGERMFRTGDRARIDRDGRINLVGRADDMVKVRGFRVETRAVERTISALSAAADPVVKAFPDGNGDTQLAVFYTTSNGHPIDEQEARSRLAEMLPDYMVPTQWRFLPEMPLNVNGKINRLVLGETAAQPSVPRPAIPVAIDLRRLVATTLGAILDQPIDLEQTFWESGGTSLSFIDLGSRLEKELGVEVRAEDIMENDTPDLLAAFLLDKITSRGRTAAPAVSARA
jgi:amino acid adenylation domain-containing protein